MDQDTADAIAIIEKQLAEKDEKIAAMEKAIGELNATITTWLPMWRAFNAFAKELHDE
jgi:prefoldin subunit 5